MPLDVTSPKSVDTPIKKVLKKNRVLTGIASSLAMYEGADQIYQRTKTWHQKHFRFKVKVSESDRIYDVVLDWLMTLIPESQKNQRSLVVSSLYGRYLEETVEPTPVGSVQKVKPLRVHYDDHQTLRIRLDGYPVRVDLSMEKSEGSKGRYMKDRWIEFFCSSKDGQKAVIKHLEKINANHTKVEPALWMTGTWGDWIKRADLPARTLDSVVLPPEQKQRLVQDFSDFISQESRYNELAIPWHRGYMFYGAPGTGKTSLAKALANYFGMDLWYISLADLKDGADLLGLIRGVRTRSILLLEDIDIAKITHDRKEGNTKEGEVSLAALLNALDGVATPHGLISIMTTNDRSKLEPALLRAGRIDRSEEICLPGPDEISELFLRFYGEQLWDRHSNVGGMSQADISEVFKRHLDNPGEAKVALDRAMKDAREMVRGRV